MDTPARATPTDQQIAAAHAVIVKEVGEHLAFNVAAYGKPWTGEGEDTEFIVGKAAAKALEAAANIDSARNLNERILNHLVSSRKAALWFAENEPGTPVPEWVDDAINDIDPGVWAAMRDAGADE